MASASDDVINALAQRPQPVVSVVSTSTSTALRVDYDGRYPPLELFFVWTSLGWQAPIPASPPREAIDWSTPDPARGTQHTIRHFSATGTATLDTASRLDADDLVRDALDAAVRLGCRVERSRPDDDTEIDLRDPLPETTRTALRQAGRSPRSRKARGALARVRAEVPQSSIGAADEAGRGIGAEVSTDDDALVDAEGERRFRVTYDVPASTADAAMRVLGSFATGTPTIEIVSSRSVASPAD